MKHSHLLVLSILLFAGYTLAITLTKFSIEQDYLVQASHSDLVIAFDADIPNGQEIIFGTTSTNNCLLFDDKLEPENFISHEDPLCFLDGETPTAIGRIVSIEQENDTVKGCKNKFATDETIGTSFKFLSLVDSIPAGSNIRCKTKIAVHANFDGPIYVGYDDVKPVVTEFAPKVLPLKFSAHLYNKKSHFEMKINTNSFGSHPFQLSCEQSTIPCHLNTANIYCNNRLGRLFSREAEDGSQHHFVYAAAINRDITCQFHLDDYYPTVADGAEVPKLSLIFPEIPDEAKRKTEEVSFSLTFSGARVFYYYNEAEDGKSAVADLYFEVPNHSREMAVGSEYEWVIDEDFLDLLAFPEKPDEDGKIRYYSSQQYADDLAASLPLLPVEEFIFERTVNPIGLKMIFNGKADELIDDAVVRGRIPFDRVKLSTFSEDTINIRYTKHGGKPIPKDQTTKNTFTLDLRGYLRIRDSAAEINRDTNEMVLTTTVESATMNIDSTWYIGYRFDTYIPSIVEEGLTCSVELREKEYSHTVSNRAGDYYVSSDLNVKHGETIVITCTAPFPSHFTQMDMTITTVAGVLGHRYLKTVPGFTPSQLIPSKLITIKETTKYSPKKLSKLVINYPAYIDNDKSTVFEKLEAIINQMKTQVNSKGALIYKNLEWDHLYLASLTIDDMYEDRSVISPFESHYSWLHRTTAMGFHAEIYIDQQLSESDIKEIESFNVDAKDYVTPHPLRVDYFTVNAFLPAEADTRCLGRATLGSYNCMKLYPGQGCTYHSQCYHGECIERTCRLNAFNLPSSAVTTTLYVAVMLVLGAIIGIVV